VLQQVQPAPIDEGVDMSILGKIRRPQGNRKRTSLELARALRTAPTRASREELLLLQNR
jgi:hypothetical protein